MKLEEQPFGEAAQNSVIKGHATASLHTYCMLGIYLTAHVFSWQKWND